MRVAIRADAGPEIGAGHVMRCLALAQALLRKGHEVHFIGHIATPWVKERLLTEQIETTFLEGGAPDRELPENLLIQVSLLGAVDWVVLDGYSFHFDCQEALRKAGLKLLYIDDYAHLPEYSCDILLNQNLGSKELVYVGPIGKKLLEIDYVLIREEFIDARNRQNMTRSYEKVENILINAGGGNQIHALEGMIGLIDNVLPMDATYRVVIGGMDPAEVRKIFDKRHICFESLNNIFDMSKVLRHTDLCITAGGSTCWELCCLGVPFLATCIVENQYHVVEALCQEGLTAKYTLDNFVSFYKDAGTRCRYGNRMYARVSGNGALQVVREMESLL